MWTKKTGLTTDISGTETPITWGDIGIVLMGISPIIAYFAFTVWVFNQ